MKTIGILSQYPKATALCFLTCCEEGARRLGPLTHPDIVVATATLGVCLPAYASGDLDVAVPFLKAAVNTLHAAGADFYVCAANMPHGALALFADQAPIPCLHIADAVAAEISANGWRRAGVLGARSTMTGTVYRHAFRAAGIEKLIPEAGVHDRLDEIVCQEVREDRWLDTARADLIAEIVKLEDRGADCVCMTCGELSILLASDQSSLPIVDSTRVLARAAVDIALSDMPLMPTGGWLSTRRRPRKTFAAV